MLSMETIVIILFSVHIVVWGILLGLFLQENEEEDHSITIENHVTIILTGLWPLLLICLPFLILLYLSYYITKKLKNRKK
jgi:uncharacterized protein YneF (UPF0154 family)